MCFVGRFALGTDDEIIPLLRDNKKVFVVTSIGGSAIAAARLGLHILEKKIDVAAFEFCYSACANYIFLAGRSKYVADQTLLAWHGAPREAPSWREKMLDTNGMLVMTYHLSEFFFKKSGIDRTLAIVPNPSNPDYPAWRSRLTSGRDFGWTWTQLSLEQRFGVRGIARYWHPENPEVLRALGERYRVDLLVDR